jgi:nucleoside-diphosphate-sugar epimerase
MRIFLTGATGFVGSAIVQELLRSGHQVLGLARSDATAKSLVQRGAEVHRGDLEDLESLRAGALIAQAVIHTAFNHDFSKFQASCETDRRVIEVLGAALEGSKRPLIVTSAIGILPRGRLATEETGPASGPSAHPRAASEEAAAAVAARGVRVSIVRLPPSVHGDGDHGFVPIVIRVAREKGASVYADEGRNLWPAVHRLDAAHLYKLVLEKGVAGARYHAVAEEGVQFRDIAGVIGRRLNVPVVSKNADEAAKHFGWFAHFAAMDIKASSQQTRRQVGWHPEQAELLVDLDRPNYFEG